MTHQPLYFEGMSEALDRLETMDEAALLKVLDSLYGRDALKYGATREDLLAEARIQVRRDFTNMHPEAVAERASVAAFATALASSIGRSIR